MMAALEMGLDKGPRADTCAGASVSNLDKNFDAN